MCKIVIARIACCKRISRKDSVMGLSLPVFFFFFFLEISNKRLVSMSSWLTSFRVENELKMTCKRHLPSLIAFGEGDANLNWVLDSLCTYKPGGKKQQFFSVMNGRKFGSLSSMELWRQALKGRARFPGGKYDQEISSSFEFPTGIFVNFFFFFSGLETSC